MNKSARVLGQEFGMSAREMNELLHEHDYINGKPGAWRITDRGRRYAEVKQRSNGHGGWAERNWETTTWRDGIIEALKEDMAETREPVEENANDISESTDDLEFDDKSSLRNEKDGSDLRQLIGFVVIGYAAVSYVGANAKPIYRNKLKPTAKKIRDKFRKNKTVDDKEDAKLDGIDTSKDK